MQFNQSQEYLRLTGEYRARSDEELLDLNLDFVDLTETAQQVLSAELRSRGLDKKIAEEREASTPKDSPWAKREIPSFGERAALPEQGSLSGSIIGGSSAQPVPDDGDGDSEADEAVDYTWKTMLVEGLEYDQSWQIYEVLRRAGIESWIERPGGGRASRVADHFDGDIRVLVAADELDRARAIIANPIPQDIIDESHETVPDYEPPRCPSCGGEDPVLESAEPVNAWKCENCGAEWTDPAPDTRPAGSPF
jgi:hypothetical protein